MYTSTKTYSWLYPRTDLTVKGRDQLSNAIYFCEVSIVRASRSSVCMGRAIEETVRLCYKPRAVASAVLYRRPDTERTCKQIGYNYNSTSSLVS